MDNDKDDDKVQIRDITGLFHNERCKTLKGKPKLFFFQTCQGSGKTVDECQDDDAESSGQVNSEPRMIPNEDFLLGFPTVTGFQSYLHPKDGSLYIGELVRALKRKKNEDLLSILTIVNKNVAKLTGCKSEGQSVRQTPAYQPTLTKTLYLADPTAKELQQILRRNIKKYVKDDPIRVLKEAETPAYIEQQVTAYEVQAVEGEKKTKTIPQETIDELLAACSSEGQRIFVYGDAGMGKSSLCYHLAQIWAEGKTDLFKQFDLVFPISLQSVHSESLDDMIAKDVQLIPFKYNHRIEWEIREKSVLFLLDSFEDLSTKPSTEINKLISRELWPKSSVLITARPGHKLEEQEDKTKRFIKAHLSNLTENQVTNYIAEYPGLNRDVQDMEKIFGMRLLCKPIDVWLCCLVAKMPTSSNMSDTQTSLLNLIIKHHMLVYKNKRKLSDFLVESALLHLGLLSYDCLRDNRRFPKFNEGVLSKAERMAIGLFSKSGNEFPHPLFQEFLAALFLLNAKWTRENLLKEIVPTKESSLIEMLRPLRLENTVRFLVGLLPGVGKKLSELFCIRQRITLDNDVHFSQNSFVENDLSYELSLLRECCDKSEKAVIAEAILRAPIMHRLSPGDQLPIGSSYLTESHLLLPHLDRDQQLEFLNKYYGLDICNQELDIRNQDKTMVHERESVFLDSFVVGVICLHNYTVGLRDAYFRHCRVPVSVLLKRLAAVEKVTLYCVMLCDKTESEFMASLGLTPRSDSAASRQPEQLSLHSVTLLNFKGLSVLAHREVTLPTTSDLAVGYCEDVDLGTLQHCFPEVKKLFLSYNRDMQFNQAGQWSSVRELYLSDCFEVDLVSLREMFTQLEKLTVCRTKLVRKRNADSQTQWHTVKELQFLSSHLCTDEAVESREEVGAFLTNLCPQAMIWIEGIMYQA